MSVISGGKKDDLGRVLITPSAYEHAEEDGGFDGHQYTCLANTISIFDEPVSEIFYVQGAICWWKTPHIGDYAEFGVVDKDDVLGYFTPLGLTVGTDVLEVAKYVRKFSPPPWDYCMDIRQRTAGKVFPGLYLRYIYNNTHATEDVECGINYVDYQGSV